MIFYRGVLLFLLLAVTFQAQAKLFNMQDASLGAYLRGTYAPTSFTNTLNSESKGSGVILDSDHPYSQSAELGMVIGSKIVNVRLGVEFIRPPTKNTEGKDSSSDADLYSLTSEISVIAPKIAAEVNIKKWAKSRFFVEAGYGYATLVARNSYSFETAGTTKFGLADFYEDLRGTTNLYEGAVGFETVLSDTTALVLEGGYRALEFTDINHNHDATTFQGAVAKDDHARNSDGKLRSLDLSGGFAAVSFRFWFK